MSTDLDALERLCQAVIDAKGPYEEIAAMDAFTLAVHEDAVLTLIAEHRAVLEDRDHRIEEHNIEREEWRNSIAEAADWKATSVRLAADAVRQEAKVARLTQRVAEAEKALDVEREERRETEQAMIESNAANCRRAEAAEQRVAELEPLH